jgi:hypothetical protein
MGDENEIPKELEMRRATPDGKLSLLVCYTSNGRPPTPKKFANKSKAADVPPPWPQSLSEIQAPLCSTVWAKDVIGEKAGWPGKKRVFLTGSYDSTFGLQEVGDDHLTPLALFACQLHPEPRHCTDQAEENASSRGSQRAREAELSTTAFPRPSSATWWSPSHRHAVKPSSGRLVILSPTIPSSTQHRAIFIARKQAPIYSPRQEDNQPEAKHHTIRVVFSQSLLLSVCPPLRKAPAHPRTLACLASSGVEALLAEQFPAKRAMKIGDVLDNTRRGIISTPHMCFETASLSRLSRSILFIFLCDEYLCSAMDSGICRSPKRTVCE